MDPARWRDAFPVTQRYRYLDHATLGPLPRRVTEAMTRLLEERAAHGSLPLPRWTEAVEAARARAAAFIGARPEEVAFVKNTTEGVLLAAEAIDWRAGDNVVTPEGEFPANAYPWLALGARGVELRRVPPDPEGRVRAADLLDRVDGRTRAVALSHVQFSTGFAADLAALGRALKGTGVLLFVDAAQSLGALRLDVRAAGISLLAANSGKWLLGPGGAGIFFCAAGVLDRLRPTNVGWRSVRLAGDLRGLGCEVLSPRGPGEGSGIVAFRVPGQPAAEIVSALRERGVVVSLCQEAVRVSPHFYNHEADLDRLLELLPPPRR